MSEQGSQGKVRGEKKAYRSFTVRTNVSADFDARFEFLLEDVDLVEEQHDVDL